MQVESVDWVERSETQHHYSAGSLLAPPLVPRWGLERESHTRVTSAPTRIAPAALSWYTVIKRPLGGKMEIHELVIEMKLLERRLTLYEEKYGVLSEDFYNALMAGDLARYDAYDETRADFSRWKGIYETWLRRKQAYAERVRQRALVETLRVQPAY